MVTNTIGKKITAAALAVLLFVMSAPLTVFAADDYPTVEFVSTYNESSNTLQLEVMLTHSMPLSQGFVALEYDTSVLSISKGNLKVGDTSYYDEEEDDTYSLVMIQKYLDKEKGYVGMDFGSNGKPFPASSEPRQMAIFTFSFVDGKTINDLDENSIKICDDFDFLDNVCPGYGHDGGVLFVGIKSACYSTVEGNIKVELNYLPEDEITSLAAASVTTTAGIAPELPKTVKATHESGKSSDVAVTWNSVSADKYASEGTFDVEGTVEGTTIKAKCTVTVNAAVIKSLAKASATTFAGTAPVLPQQVEATYSNNSKSNVAVTWDAIDASKYAQAGTFTVNGTVAGTDIKAECEVTVNAVEITALASASTTTAAGVAPVLPEQVEASYSNGGNGNVVVTWDAVDASKYAKEGTFTVNGTVEGTSIKAACEVTVTAAVIKSVEKSSVVTVATVAPVLPAEVNAVYTDNSTKAVSVTWDAVDASKYAKAGKFTVNGTVEGTDIKAECEVTVNAAEITSLETAKTTTSAGTAPNMPVTVTANYSNNSSAPVAVVWDAVDASKYAKEGTFTVNGTVEGTSIKAVCEVTVTAAVIKSVKKSEVTTIVEVAPVLPETVTVVYTDSSTVNANVKWDAIDASKYAQTGTFTVNGTVEGTSIKAVCEVTVKAAEITALTAVKTSTAAGIAPVLPEKVVATYSNNKTGDVAVAWDEIDASKYAQTGTFTVNGTVAGTSLKAECEVTVTPAVIKSVANVSVITKAGVAPVLPETVNATYSDSSVSEVAVVWNSVDSELYNEAGSFTVEGTVDGYASKVICTVTVTEAEVVSLNNTEATAYEGSAPVLPKTVKAVLTNGKTADVAVTWEAIDESKYAQAGTFEVIGTVEGFDGTVTCTVTVYEVTVESVETVTVSTKRGVAPELPATVKVNYSNGTSADAAVVWDAVDEASYAEAGSFTVNGTVEGTELNAVANVTVTSSKIFWVYKTSVSTEAGQAPELPQTVMVKYWDGTVGQVSVTWDAVSADEYAEAGLFKVRGKINGTILRARCYVTVEDHSIKSVYKTRLSTQIGVAPVLPDQVMVKYNDNSKGTANVTWDSISPEDYAKSGTFVVEGKVEGTDKTAECVVTVRKYFCFGGLWS